MKSFSQERKKEKEKLKSLENIHFQNHFSKQTVQVFLSKLRFLMTFACLIIIYIFKGFGEDDLRYLGYLSCWFCVGIVFAPWTQGYGKISSGLLRDPFGACTVPVAAWLCPRQCRHAAESVSVGGLKD